MTLFPLVLVAKKEYLERLQKGSFYMRNCLYYQTIAGEDIQRGDKYDGAVKCGYKGYGIPDSIQKIVSNPRLTTGLGNYIKCFFHYSKRDVKVFSNSYVQFALSSESQNVLQEFNEEYALFVFDVDELIRRFSDACKKMKLQCFYDDVEYFTEDEYESYERSLYCAIHERVPNDDIPDPVFVKRDLFEKQQEYRFCVKYEQEIEDGKIYEEAKTINIGNIEDISIIVKLSDICKHPIIMDYEKEMCYIVEPSEKGEEDERKE